MNKNDIVLDVLKGKLDALIASNGKIGYEDFIIRLEMLSMCGIDYCNMCEAVRMNNSNVAREALNIALKKINMLLPDSTLTEEQKSEKDKIIYNVSGLCVLAEKFAKEASEKNKKEV